MQTISNPKTISKHELWSTAASSRTLITERGVGFVVQTVIDLSTLDSATHEPYVVTIAKQPGSRHRVTASVQPVLLWGDYYHYDDYRCYPNGPQFDIDAKFAVAALQQHLPDASAEEALRLVDEIGQAQTD